MPKRIIETLCPVCGRTMHRIVLHKEYSKEEWKKYGHSFLYLEYGHKPRKLYLDYLNEKWDLDKPHWGIIRECIGGRNPGGSREGRGFPIVDYLHEEEDNPALFAKWINQVKNGLAWLVKRKWLSLETLEDWLKEFKSLS